MLQLFLGFFLPFLGTVLGASVVFYIGKNLNAKLEQLLLGFAGGMMFAASIWSLLLPAINQTEIMPQTRWLPAMIGFVVGVLFLWIIDLLSSNIENKGNSVLHGKKTGKMMLAIIIHNIPEGVAVGVAIAGAYYGNSLLTLSSALSFAIGIAVQNFPDGAMVSLPLFVDGNSKTKSFWLGVVSGLLELISAVVAFFITDLFASILPFVLAFASGATMFVVVKDLIPNAQADKKSNLATLAFMIGFLTMILFDILI